MVNDSLKKKIIKKIVKYTKKGLKPKEIADKLTISISSVYKYRNN